jgi:hypothetical protein
VEEAMEQLAPPQVVEWFNELGEPVLSLPGLCISDQHRLIDEITNVKRSLGMNAERQPPDVPPFRAVTWWQVRTTALGLGAGITCEEALVAEGPGLGWCRWPGCQLDVNARFPLAAVAFYQGNLAGGIVIPGVSEVAGFSVLLRYGRVGSGDNSHLVVHVSPTGVRYGHCDAEQVSAIFTSAETGESFPFWGWSNVTPALESVTKAAPPALKDLARHIGGIQFR